MTDDHVDPRVARTRRDVVAATANLLQDEGWDAVTHAAVARAAGYSKATVYGHWPRQLDLIAAAIEKICDVDEHPVPTGDLRADVRASLNDFANDLTEGHLDRLLAGVVERGNRDDVVRDLRLRLYDTGTRALRAILEAHLDARDIDSTLALLTGAIFVRVTFEGKPATAEFVDDVIDRVIGPVERA